MMSFELNGFRVCQRVLLAVVLLFTQVVGASAGGKSVPRVVADIAPIHSLVAQVMAGVGTPDLLLSGAQSPHDYALRPSDARKLAQADVIVWTGPALTPWLADTVSSLAPDAQKIVFMQVPGVSLLPLREGVGFASEDHDHDHDHDDDHAEEGDETAVDPHLWLDPKNAGALIAELARVLSVLDPANQATYQKNAVQAQATLGALELDIAARLQPVRSARYAVYHDAYHYFEDRFALQSTAAVALGDAVAPGAKRLRQIKQVLADQGVRCIFAEPQFDPKLLRSVLSDARIQTGLLDPIGASLSLGPDQYFAMMRGLADDMASCLEGAD